MSLIKLLPFFILVISAQWKEHTLKLEGVNGNKSGCITTTSSLNFSWSVVNGNSSRYSDWIGVYYTGECNEEWNSCPSYIEPEFWGYIEDINTHGFLQVKTSGPVRSEGPLDYVAYYFVDDSYGFAAKTAHFTMTSCRSDYTIRFDKSVKDKYNRCVSREDENGAHKRTALFEFEIAPPHTTDSYDWIGIFDTNHCFNKTCKPFTVYDWSYVNNKKETNGNDTHGLTKGTIELEIPPTRGIYKVYYLLNDEYTYYGESKNFSVGCNLTAVFRLNLTAVTSIIDTHVPLVDACINATVNLNFTWEIEGDSSFAIDRIGIFEENKCLEKQQSCDNSAGFHKFVHVSDVGKTTGTVSIPTFGLVEESGSMKTYVAYYFTNEGLTYVAKSKPFVVKYSCDTSHSSYIFLQGMIIFAVIGVIVIVAVVVVKKFFLNSESSYGEPIEYSRVGTNVAEELVEDADITISSEDD